MSTSDNRDAASSRKGCNESSTKAREGSRRIAAQSPKRIACIFAAAILAFVLCACGGTGSSSAAKSAGSGASTVSSTVGESAQSDSDVRAEIEQTLARARENMYKNVTFDMTTETTVTGTDDKGQQVQQGVRTKMNGELNNSEKKPAMHFAYESVSSSSPTKTAYDMYIDKDRIIVKQGDQLFVAGEDVAPENYVNTITGVASEKEVSQLLDVAKNCKIETDENTGDTAITITADVDKLVESGIVDTSSLPENTSIATMVANYIVSSDDHLKTTRIMSSTVGTPTYRVSQVYNFSKFDETELPDWPSLADLAATDSRIKKDADGQMYIIGEDGQKYYIDSINEDGTITLKQPDASDQALISYGNPNATTTRRQSGDSSSGGKNTSDSDLGKPQFTGGDSSPTSGNEGAGDAVFTGGDATGANTGDSAGANTNTDDVTLPTDTDTTETTQGRAYITASDGTIHYLDEPGSEIRDIGGSRVFIDANGEWYFLNE